MHVTVNGREVVIDDGAVVADAARMAGVGHGERGVALALDGEVVPGRSWERTLLADGAVLEVVRAAAGG